MIQETIHGYPIIAIASLPDIHGLKPNRRVVLIDRGSDHLTRYVVSIHVAGEAEWVSGTYTGKLAKAIDHFNEAWRRYAL